MIPQTILAAALAVFTTSAAAPSTTIVELCEVDADYVFDDGRSVVYDGVPAGQDDAVDCLLGTLAGNWLVQTVRAAVPSWGLVELEIEGTTVLFSAITDTRLFLAVHTGA